MAETTAVSLYRNLFILTRGDFDDKRLVETYLRLLTSDGVSIRKAETPDGVYVTLTMQTGAVQSTLHISSALHIPEAFYNNGEIRKVMIDTVVRRAPEIVKRPDLDPKRLSQFFGGRAR